MKLTEILNMEAGPELNKLVGKTFDLKPETDWRVMNPEHTAYCIQFDFYSEAKRWWGENKERYRVDDPQCNFYKYELVEWETWPRVSEDISAAWVIVEKMLSMGYHYTLNYLVKLEYPEGIRHCCFAKLKEGFTGDIRMTVMNDYNHYHARCKEVPESICKAALIAIFKERSELEE